MITSPGGGESEKLKKEDGSMVQGQVFLKRYSINYDNLNIKEYKRLKLIFDRKQQLNWYICSFDICLNQERLVGRIRAGGIYVRIWGTV